MTLETTAAPAIDKQLLAGLARTIRGLAIDGVERAKSGHPGMPLGCADFAALLWYYHLRHDPAHPEWVDRDRFVLSAGHGSMLLYSLLHLAGYEEMTLEQLRNFRQWGSKTAGHPENFLAKGIETTTGPLGQGFGNGVGMALAAHMMEARFPGLMDCRVYGIVSDGDLMEGVAAEAASFAGHHKLGRIVYFYDDNQITIEGETSLTFSREDVAKRFEAYGWQVQTVDGHDFDAMNEALAAAKAETERPSLIVGRTVIGFGSPNKANTADVHGSPLGPEEAKRTKEALGLPADREFDVPAANRAAWAARAKECAGVRAAWGRKFEALRGDRQREFQAYFEQQAPDLKLLRPQFPAGKDVATRKASGAAINAYAAAVPWLVGGSADLAPSTNTLIDASPSVAPDNFSGRNLHFGVREHAMGAILNGMALFGAFRPYGATFLIFSDYMRPSIRLACLMNLPVVYVFTHDSIFLGEDGPTHQPVEHLAALRAIPRMTVIRPGDADETAVAWEYVLSARRGPVALSLTRQNLPTFDRAAMGLAAADNLAQGGYVLRREKGAAPQLILVATGSELQLAVRAAEQLENDGASVRVVSMPSVDLFRRQPQSVRDDVLPPGVRKRLVIEAGRSAGWHDIATDEGDYVTQEEFGHSAPWKVIAEHCGFTVENVVRRARELMGR